jgi:thymidylate synthase
LNRADEQYLDLLRDVLAAPVRPDRTGTGTRARFGRQMRFDLADGFPLLTTKKLPFRVIAAELLWFLSGSTNAKDLEDQGVTIWREWGDPDTRELGPIYGKQWRTWWCDRPEYQGPIDQISRLLDSLRDDPYGRRHVVSAWNVADIEQMALPPCHCLFQFHVGADERLHLQLYQRSADVFLGLPFNIASYALLLEMTAYVLGRQVGEFVWTGGDVHLYVNHEAQAREQLTRSPRPMPSLWIEGAPDSLDNWSTDDLHVVNYQPHPHIAAEVSI